MDTQRELFFENPKLLGLARQIGPKNLGSLVHGLEHVVVLFHKILDFRPKTYNSQI